MATGINIRAAQRAGDHRTVTVGRDGTGDFPTIKEALDYVGRFSNTVTNFAVIKVGPGTHTVNNSTAPITLPSFCAIIGDSEAVCNIQGTDNTKNLFIAGSLYIANIAFGVCDYAIAHSSGGTVYIRECEADGANTCGGLCTASASGVTDFTFIQRCAGAFCTGTFIKVTAGAAIAIEKCNIIGHLGTNIFDISGGSDVQIVDNVITLGSATNVFNFSGGAIFSFNNVVKNTASITNVFNLSGASGSLTSKNDVVLSSAAQNVVMGAGMAFTHNFINAVLRSTKFTLNGNVAPYSYTDLALNGNSVIKQSIGLISTGAAPAVGNAVLVAGTKTVSTTAATSTCVIILTRKTAGGTTGELTYTINAGVSFTINSANALDTSTISWQILEAY
jgi:hypothetical protein